MESQETIIDRIEHLKLKHTIGIIKIDAQKST